MSHVWWDFTGLGVPSAPGAAVVTSLEAQTISIVAGAGQYGLLAVANGGGTAVQGTVNSGQGIGVEGTSVATTVPAVLGVSTGYYAGLFYNITDGGSSAINANHIGLVTQSVYAQGLYVQQGAASGAESTLARSNILPACYVTRVTANLNGHDFTAPVLTVEDTTNGSGDLCSVIVGGSTKFQITHAGTTNVFGTFFAQGATTFGASQIVFWNTRAIMDSPADGQWRLTNNAQTAGFLVDGATDATMKIRTRTNGADAAITAGAATFTGTLFASGATTFGAAQIVFWNTRAIMDSPADGQWRLTNNAQTAGVLIDAATDAVAKVRTRAGSAYATVDALGYNVGGVAGASGTFAVVTVVNGIVTSGT